RCGIMSTHGPHHVAQNSTTYTLPGSNDVTSRPASHFVTFIGGAGSPSLSVICRRFFGSSARDTELTRNTTAILRSRMRMANSLENHGRSLYEASPAAKQETDTSHKGEPS